MLGFPEGRKDKCGFDERTEDYNAGKIFNKIIANSSFSFIIPRISKHKTNFLIGKLKIVLRTFGYKTVQSLRETCIERTYEAIM